MVADNSKVVDRCIIVLNQMIPRIPLPHNVCLIIGEWFDFDNLVGPDVAATAWRIACNGWIPASLCCFCLGFILPCNRQNISIWHWFNIVMSDGIHRRVFPRPFSRSVPRDAFNFSSNASATEITNRLLTNIGGS